MGDRCYLTVRFRRCDAAKVAELLPLGLDEGTPVEDWADEHEDGGLELTEEEANYGWCDDLDALAYAGVPFLYDHDEGGEYPAMSGAALDGEYHQVSTPRHIGYCVEAEIVDGKARIKDGHLEALQAFCDTQQKVLDLLAQDVPGEPLSGPGGTGRTDMPAGMRGED